MTATRRQFVRSLGATAALASTQAITPRIAMSANETVRIACIGTGSRCRQLMEQVPHVPGLRIVQVCDLWDWALGEGKKLADPNATTTKHYQEVFDNKDVDAVLIATPDHWHVPLTLAACEAGKDVYVEKPLTHNLAEGEAVIAAQNENKRIVQVGQQQRSMTHLREARERYIESGVIGDIYQVRLWWDRSRYDQLAGPPLDLRVDPEQVDWKTWLGDAKPRPFDVQQFRQWRFYWDFGGGILTDLMVHLLDVVHWYLDLEMAETAVASGGSYFNNQGWDVPDTLNAAFTYKDRPLSVVFHGTFANGLHGAGIEFQGRHGTLYVDRGRYEFHPLDRDKAPEIKTIDDHPRGYEDTRPEQDRAHLQNWIDCVRSREKPHCPAEVGVWSAGTAHMGNLAYREERVYRRGG